MESIEPTPLKRFIINTSNHTSPTTIITNLLSRENLFRVGKLVLQLETAIIVTIIINVLLSRTNLYDRYIKKVEPKLIKLGSVKIKSRRLIAMLIKYLILTLSFSIIVILI
tara:strand:+ start:1760 stop:2092 length:333 start_codon:yes stop_codon:yes gene_type:complete